MPAVKPWMNANRTVGMPARAPPIIGRKSTRATHRPHSSGNGTPRISRVTNTTIPAVSEVSRSPNMYPVTLPLTSAAIRVTVAWRSWVFWPSVQFHIFGPSSSRSRTRTKLANNSTILEIAPLPAVRAGLASDWA
jgi:hypothetical protein